MGKIRNFLRFLWGGGPTLQAIHPPCSHMILPEQKRFPKIIANSTDQCLTCRQKICTVCSQFHIQNHCNVKLNTNKNMGEGKLKEFNQGNLMKLPLDGLKCICGTALTLTNPQHAMCAACGLASCSTKCHKDWEDLGNCTYHNNFYELPESEGMRSILFQNIANIQKAKISKWNVANKTSLAYIVCYAKKDVKSVILQRGYRNYGIPQPELVQKMVKVQSALDVHTHIERVCTCQCIICTQRQVHSVGNCQISCIANDMQENIELRSQGENHYECKCSCEFCTSGVLIQRHMKSDCMFHCYKSKRNISKIL